MNLRDLFTEERAVSPVIGVILMVAITVILAAVIGTFVLGLGDSLQDTSPQASFSADQGTSTYTNGSDYDLRTLTITHEGGDSIADSELSVTVNGAEALGDDGTSPPTTESLWDGGNDVTAGSSVTVVAYNNTATGTSVADIAPNADYSFADSYDVSALNTGDTVRVTWTSSDGSSSQNLFTREIN